MLNIPVVTEKAYGKNSTQYIKAKLFKANLYIMTNQLNLCYKTCLDTYDLAKEVYGNEENLQSSSILSLMARVKESLKEYEDAVNIIEKAKKIESKINSKHSLGYKLLEEQVAVLEKKFQGKIPKTEKKSLLLRILPNTPKKAAVFFGVIMVGAGIIFAMRKKQN